MQNLFNLRPEICSFFEELLNNGLELRVRVTGRSMWPFLKGNEILTIRKVVISSLKIGDLILFKNRIGMPVLHRIIKKRRIGNNHFSFCTKGDALLAHDDEVNGNQVMGKACKIEKHVSDTGMHYINLESYRWSTINYLTALTSSGKSRIYFFGSKCISLPLFRSAIKNPRLNCR
jgi:signal peptidase I